MCFFFFFLPHSVWQHLACTHWLMSNTFSLSLLFYWLYISRFAPYSYPQVTIRWLHVLYCQSVTSTFSVPTTTSSSSPPPYSLHPFSLILLPHSYWLHSSILVQPSCSPSPLPSSLSHSIILASHSEQSSASQIDFAAVLRSPINSQIGFPAYPLPPALWISFFLSQLPPLFSLIPASSLLAFCLSSVLLSLFSRHAASLSSSDTFPLVLSLYTHSFLSATAEVSYRWENKCSFMILIMQCLMQYVNPCLSVCETERPRRIEKMYLCRDTHLTECIQRMGLYNNDCVLPCV